MPLPPSNTPYKSDTYIRLASVLELAKQDTYELLPPHVERGSSNRDEPTVTIRGFNRSTRLLDGDLLTFEERELEIDIGLRDFFDESFGAHALIRILTAANRLRNADGDEFRFSEAQEFVIQRARLREQGRQRKRESVLERIKRSFTQ